ncbi:hypothetical protein Bca101_055435 [Brassica carinata]
MEPTKGRFEVEKFDGEGDFALWKHKVFAQLEILRLDSVLQPEEVDIKGKGSADPDPGHYIFMLDSMEAITEGVNSMSLGVDTQKKNRIQVSHTKKPLFFYVNLAKRYMQQYTDVELSALGMAIATVVTVAEILKNNGFAVEKKIMTTTVDIKDDSRGRPVQKAKIEITLAKSEKFDELMAAATEEKEAAEAQEQS